MNFINFHVLYAVSNTRFKSPCRKPALFLLQENVRYFAGLQGAALLCTAFPLSGHFARLFQPAHPAASLPPPAFAARLSLGRTTAVPHGYTRPSGRGDQRPGRVSGPTAGAQGGSGGQRQGLAPNATGWRGRRWASPFGDLAGGSGHRPRTEFLLRFLSPAERTVRTAPAL